RNLELIHSPHENAKTLLTIMDNTQSAMGARLLNRWMVMVLKDVQRIKSRQEVVEFFLKNDENRNLVREKIKSLSDLERMAGKISTGKITPKQLLLFAQSLQTLAEIKQEFSSNKEIEYLIKEIKDWT